MFCLSDVKRYDVLNICLSTQLILEVVTQHYYENITSGLKNAIITSTSFKSKTINLVFYTTDLQ